MFWRGCHTSSLKGPGRVGTLLTSMDMFKMVINYHFLHSVCLHNKNIQLNTWHLPRYIYHAQTQGLSPDGTNSSHLKPSVYSVTSEEIITPILMWNAKVLYKVIKTHYVCLKCISYLMPFKIIIQHDQKCRRAAYKTIKYLKLDKHRTRWPTLFERVIITVIICFDGSIKNLEHP